MKITELKSIRSDIRKKVNLIAGLHSNRGVMKNRIHEFEDGKIEFTQFKQ